MAEIDKELWVSSDEDESYYDAEAPDASADSTFFQLGLGRVGQKGGINRPAVFFRCVFTLNMN